MLYSLSVHDVLDKNNWKQYHQWQSELIKYKQIYLFAENFICLPITFSFIDCQSIAINRLHPEQLFVAIIDIGTTLGRLNRWGINFDDICEKYVHENCLTSWKGLKRCSKCEEFNWKWWKCAKISCNIIENLGHGNISTRKLFSLKYNTLEQMIKTSLTISDRNHLQEIFFVQYYYSAHSQKLTNIDIIFCLPECYITWKLRFSSISTNIKRFLEGKLIVFLLYTILILKVQKYNGKSW